MNAADATQSTFPDLNSLPSDTQTLLEKIAHSYPCRRPGSEQEREAQTLMGAFLAARGFLVELAPFRFNESLYANLALHFGLGVLGLTFFRRFPTVSAAMQLSAGLSYLLDSSRKGYFLRRLLPWRHSQNLVATFPARSGRVGLRVVLVGHADAAFTGVLFHPALVKRATSSQLPPSLEFLGRSLTVATYSLLAAGGVGLLRASRWRNAKGLWPLALGLTLPSVVAAGLNAEVVARDQTVPGVNDNLSGAIGALEVALRWKERLPEDVELVVVVTGCEEAGTGGAWQLVRQRRHLWDASSTVILGLDGLSNGDLRYFQEGEVLKIPVPSWLEEAIARVVASEPRFQNVTRFHIPAGASDAIPFLEQGYDAVTLGCVDPALGSPRHYHRMDDTLENLDRTQLTDSLDFAEKLVGEVLQAHGSGRAFSGGRRASR